MTQPSERKRRAPIASGELTVHQRRRKDYLFKSGKNQLDVAREISAADGKPCSRQAVEAEMMDRNRNKDGTVRHSPRIAEGFCRAVNYRNNVARLFPGYRKPKKPKN